MIHYQHKHLYLEECDVAGLVARWGTPLYLYSRQSIESNWFAYESNLKKQDHLLCYAVKANSNLSILSLLASLGAGFDIVSLGELERVLLAGGDPKKIIFSGVGKTAQEIQRALEVGIYCFNVESFSELLTIQAIAKKINRVAPIALRVNPHISVKAHPYITTGLKHNKFGMAVAQAEEGYDYASTASHLKIKGISCHLGSQITEVEPFVSALEKLLKTIKKLEKKGIHLDFVDVGGGLGVSYQREKIPSIKKYLSALLLGMRKEPYHLVLEPGRSLIATAGVLIARVEYIKKAENKNFAIVDSGMNDLIRPALYEAWHDIIPVLQRSQRKVCYDVVGPVCESSDFLGIERELSILEGDLLAVRDVGAYGFSLSSNYNTRPRAAEVLVSGKKAVLIREREQFSDLWSKEKKLNFSRGRK
ncbi:MAG: diaminopimelate decarboxylase [Gammaproteobacteria bacterium]|nr:diaminopimelate decarboxylase [Gammaproteobacteria bacterium]